MWDSQKIDSKGKEAVDFENGIFLGKILNVFNMRDVYIIYFDQFSLINAQVQVYAINLYNYNVDKYSEIN